MMNTPPISPAQALLSHTLAYCSDRLNSDDFPAAWRSLCFAVSLAPDNPAILCHRGRLALHMKESETAVNDFRAALRINPRHAAAISGVARCHLDQGEVGEAEEAADRALSIDPSDVEAGQVKAWIDAKRRAASPVGSRRVAADGRPGLNGAPNGEGHHMSPLGDLGRFTAPVLEQVRIENTNCCPNQCVFCPREKLTRPKGVQSLDDFMRVLDRVEAYSGVFAGEVHLHGYGEPLLDRNLPEKVRRVTQRWPNATSAIFTTLGCDLSSGYLEDLAAAGLRTIIVSFYADDPKRYHEVTRVNGFHRALGNLIQLAGVKEKIGPRLRVAVQTSMQGLAGQNAAARPGLAGFNQLLEGLGLEHRPFELHNFGDGREYRSSGRFFCKRALRRHILQVTWDMKVIPCCMDHNASVVLGNLASQTLEEVFSGEAARGFFAAHRTLQLGAYSICRNCNCRNFVEPSIKESRRVDLSEESHGELLSGVSQAN